MKEKNNCLNFIKGIACFGIVYMHTSYDCIVSSVIVCAFRFAVPIFFMISGYYSYYPNRQVVSEKCKKRFVHIFRLFLYAFVINELWAVVLNPFFTGESMRLNRWIESTISLRTLKKLVCFSQLGGILWFLIALMVCYVLALLINRFSLYKVAYVLGFVLIVAHIVVRGIIQYNNLVDEETNVIWFRNVWFMGFPFFIIGNLFHKKEEWLKEKFKDKQLIAFAVLGIMISFFERYMVVLELYWGTVVATFAIFIFALKNKDRKIVPLIAYIGEHCSMQIYIYQVIVYSALMSIYEKMKINSMGLLIVNPIIIYTIISVLCFAKERVLKKEK